MAQIRSEMAINDGFVAVQGARNEGQDGQASLVTSLGIWFQSVYKHPEMGGKVFGTQVESACVCVPRELVRRQTPMCQDSRERSILHTKSQCRL